MKAALHAATVVNNDGLYSTKEVSILSMLGNNRLGFITDCAFH